MYKITRQLLQLRSNLLCFHLFSESRLLNDRINVSDKNDFERVHENEHTKLFRSFFSLSKKIISRNKISSFKIGFLCLMNNFSKFKIA